MPEELAKESEVVCQVARISCASVPRLESTLSMKVNLSIDRFTSIDRQSLVYSVPRKFKLRSSQ
jgi:hypothetical protein